MESIIFFAFLWLNPDQDNFLYKKTTSENIEYCTNISFDPRMKDIFNKSCNRDVVNDYILSVKNTY